MYIVNLKMNSFFQWNTKVFVLGHILYVAKIA